MKTNKNLIIAIVVTAVVAGGGGFYGGLTFAKNSTAARGNFSQFGGNANRPGGTATNRLRQGGGFINGQILSLDDKSITVQDRNGGSKIIFFAPSTTIGKTTDGTVGDLKVGETVMASGTANADGSVTAQSIQIRPAGVPEFTGGGPQGGMMINGGQIPPGNVPNNK